jgi:peptide/nickel transport system substrate-binding protein
MMNRGGRITRRGLLRAAAAVAAGAGAGRRFGPGVRPVFAAAEPPIVLMQGVDPETLDPQFGESGPMANVLSNTVEALLAYDRGMNIVPFLAESYAVLPDQVTWRFKLRDGIKFHNGRPFDADAVKFTVERTLDPRLRAQGLNDPFPGRSGVVRATAVNRTTVDIVLKAPNVIFPVFATFLYMLEPRYYAATPPQQAAIAPVGTGPWRVQEWVKGDHLSMTAVDGYWRGAPRAREIRFRPVPEKATRLNSLIRGEGDVALGLTPDDVPVLERVSRLRVSYAAGSRRVHIGIPCDVPRYADRRVRYALHYALDYNGLAKALLGRLAPPQRSSVLVASSAWLNPALKPMAYDPQRARALLVEAKFPAQERIRIYVPVARYLKGEEVAQAVAGQLRAIGLQAEAAPIDWTVYTDKMRSPKGMDDLYLLGLGSRFNGPEDLSIVTTGQIWDQTKWITSTKNGPQFNQLYQDMSATFDPAAQKRIAFQMEGLFVEESPWISLWLEPAASGVTRRISWEDSGGGNRLTLWLPNEGSVRYVQ